MRIWEIQFQILDQMDSFPMPGELVEEVQKNSDYRIDENSRTEHNGGQLSFTLEGEGVFKDGDKEYPLTSGTAFLALHGKKDISYFYPTEGTTPWRTLWISFYGRMSEELISDIVSKYGHIFTLPLKKGVIKRLLAYRNYDNSVQPLTNGAGAKIVMDILTSLIEVNEKDSLNAPQNDIIREVRQYMLENISIDYGVSDIAEYLNISREHLSRLFKKVMGKSLTLYIREDKIRRACHLLRESQFACSEVGAKVGYKNPASFTRVFKSITNLTPGNFRTNRIYS